MIANPAGGLMLQHPTTGGFARLDIDDQQLCWNPWAPPVLLNGRAAAIRDALDGSDLEDTAHLLSEMEQRPVDEVLSELRSVVRSLALHGLLQESPPWRRPAPAVLGHDLTPCDRERLQLHRATVFDLDLGSRRITVSVADPDLAQQLMTALPFEVLTATEPLSKAAHEFAIAPADRERGFHHLYGRGGRIYARSLDLHDVIRSFLSHLGSLQWADANATDLVWLDAVALVRRGTVTLLPGQVRRLWRTMARRLTRAGHVMVASVQTGIDPATGHLVVPPPLPTTLLEMLDALHLDPPHLDPPHLDQAERSDEIAVTRVVDLVSPVELQGLRASGHDTDGLTASLLTHRLALLAHRGAADTHPSSELDHGRAEAILTAVSDLARHPQLTASIHGDPRAMLAALCS